MEGSSVLGPKYLGSIAIPLSPAENSGRGVTLWEGPGTAEGMPVSADSQKHELTLSSQRPPVRWPCSQIILGDPRGRTVSVFGFRALGMSYSGLPRS